MNLIRTRQKQNRQCKNFGFFSETMSRQPFTTRLCDMSEWRDVMFEPPSMLNDLVKEDNQEGPLREICILPFPLNDVILQGETKELCLYEKR
jgi:hypothetical protein